MLTCFIVIIGGQTAAPWRYTIWQIQRKSIILPSAYGGSIFWYKLTENICADIFQRKAVSDCWSQQAGRRKTGWGINTLCTISKLTQLNTLLIDGAVCGCVCGWVCVYLAAAALSWLRPGSLVSSPLATIEAGEAGDKRLVFIPGKVN